MTFEVPSNSKNIDSIILWFYGKYDALQLIKGPYHLFLTVVLWLSHDK